MAFLINLPLAAFLGWTPVYRVPRLHIIRKEFELALLRALLRVYSWIFEALLCLFAIGVSIVSLTVAGSDPVQFDWLPWSEHAMPAWLIGLGILGLIFVFLAMAGRMRFLLFLFAAAVFAILFKGFFFGAHSFGDPEEARNALLLVGGSLIAIFGAWPTRPAGRNYRSR